MKFTHAVTVILITIISGIEAKRKRAIIIGSNLSGLTAAYELKRNRYKVEIIYSGPEISEFGRQSVDEIKIVGEEYAYLKKYADQLGIAIGSDLKTYSSALLGKNEISYSKKVSEVNAKKRPDKAIIKFSSGDPIASADVVVITSSSSDIDAIKFKPKDSEKVYQLEEKTGESLIEYMEGAIKSGSQMADKILSQHGKGKVNFLQ